MLFEVEKLIDLQTLIDYLFCRLQEIMQAITEILLCTKDFNVLIDGKSFFDLPVKTEEGYKKIVDMSNNNEYNW